VDPVAQAIANAPPDVEPVTGEDRGRLREAQARFYRHGAQGIEIEEVLANFGLKPEDFPNLRAGSP
jgi:hypothetical protein